MRRLFGGLLMLAGFVAGAWAGIIWGLVGGIELAIRGFDATPINADDAAWGLTRCVFLWEIVGVIAFLALGVPGFRLLDRDSRRKTARKDRKYAAKYGEKWFTR